MSKLVTIYGGAGFVGRHIVRRMAKAGWRVRVVCRRPNEALFVKPYGAVGQIEVEFGNIRDDASVRMTMRGSDAVVNCVGILNALGRNGFEAVQAAGAARIARIAAETGVSKLVHISALGADAEGESLYGRTKAAGEAAVLSAFPSAMILRPSIMFGPDDHFFNRFAAMTLTSPVLPIFGADTNFQPVYVDDVAQAATAGILGTASGIYELGGPDVESFRTLMERMLTVIGRERTILGLPRFFGATLAWACGAVQSLTLGTIENKVLSGDQLKNLYHDVVVSPGAKGFADLGIEPVAMAAVLPDYLWRFRPSGQYQTIKASAVNLRKSSS